MKKLKFEIKINAPKAKVWDILWNDETYRKWTAIFHEGSHMVADWKLGGKVKFLGPDKSGMLSRITELDEPNAVVFEHYGMIDKEVEDTTSDMATAFAGALETYHLSEDNGVTTLNASVETSEEYEEIMTNGFNKGMEVVKSLSEN